MHKVVEFNNDNSFPPAIAPSRSKNNNKGKRKTEASKDFATNVISIRKPRQLNWEQQEVVSLVLAKKRTTKLH
jgi:hypothetical protein